MSKRAKTIFTHLVGHEPVLDELDRFNCPRVGGPGHMQCGVCREHKLPRYMCGCLQAETDEWPVPVAIMAPRMCTVLVHTPGLPDQLAEAIDGVLAATHVGQKLTPALVHQVEADAMHLIKSLYAREHLWREMDDSWGWDETLPTFDPPVRFELGKWLV